MSNISVCIIVKNEEKYIEDCLNSVLDIASEIIVLDTGSTDRTIEICSKFSKVSLYHMNWEDNFSKAMNKCISYAKYEWILCIDADERINEFSQLYLKDCLETHKHKDKSLIIKFHSVNVNSNRFTQNYFKCGVLRNNRGIHFIVPVHQYPVNEKNDIIIEHSKQFQFYHVQEATKESITARNEKYIKILIDFMKDSSNKGHDFYCYRHIGDSYHDLEKYDKAVEYYIKSYNSQKLVLKNFFYVENLLRLAKDILFQTQQYKEALPFIEELFNTAPNLKESLFYYAYVNHRLGFIDKAIENYLKALKLKSDFLEVQILTELGRCYISKNLKQEGLKYLKESYMKNPKSYVVFHLIKYYALDSDLINLTEYELIKNGYLQNDIDKNIDDINSFSKKEYDQLVKTKLDYLLNISGWDNWEIKEIKESIYNLERCIQR